MRKMMILVAVLGIGWTVQACKKEKNLLNKKETEVKHVIEHVRSQDGVLIFEDEQQMYDALYELSFLSDEKRTAWENKLNFRSLYTAESLIHEAEDKNQTMFYKDIDPDITLEELNKLDMNYVPSDLFREYEEKRIVSYIKNEDGSNSIQLHFEHEFYKYIVGEKMSFIAGDMKYDFNKQYLRITNTNTQDQIALIDKNETAKSGHGTMKWHKGIGNPASSNVDIDPNKKRVQSYIEFDTKLLPNQGGVPDKNSMSLNMFWINRAEERKWGNWAMRESYKPILSNYGLWYIWYEYTTFTMPNPNEWYTAYHGIQSGPNPCVIQPNGVGGKLINQSHGSGTNNRLYSSMQPSGSYASASWFNFRRAMATFQDNYSVNISGSSYLLNH